MKFTRPINREVDIDGTTFIVSFGDMGIDFRLKGKRKTAHADWTSVLEAATGEQGANARDFLGVASSDSNQRGAGEHERIEQIYEPQRTGEAQPFASADTDIDNDEELSRAVTASYIFSES